MKTHVRSGISTSLLGILGCLLLLTLVSACMPEASQVKFDETPNVNPGSNVPGLPPSTPPSNNVISFPTLPISSPPTPVNSQALYQAEAFAKIPMRRLTRQEIANSITDIFGIAPAATLLALLPEDIVEENLNPFDNDSNQQSVSSTAVENYYAFAEAYADVILKSPPTIRNLAGCTPLAADDSVCFLQFTKKIAKRMLRRPLSASDLTRFSTLLQRSLAENNAYLAYSLLTNALILTPEFLYRIEAGTPISNSSLFRLSDHEIASRMSYFIWGSAPDDALLSAADAGQLRVEATRLGHAQRLLSDSRAKKQWRSFHAQWLGYATVDLSANLAPDMIQETNMLIDKIAFESNQNWLNVFSYQKSYLTPALAQHYGLGPLTFSDWVSAPAKRGAGILTHGRFLLQGSKFGDTSPTLRGYRILKRVLCQKLGPIPPGVDTDNPPAAPVNVCKDYAYYMRKNPSCSSCHLLTDNIGFGLENHAADGKYRTVEAGKPTCTISGEGAVGSDRFTGATDLGELLSNHPAAISCATRQLFRFFAGRGDNSQDQAVLEAMHSQYLDTPEFNSMVLSMIKSPAFIHR